MEIYKVISDYPNYEVSNLGNVRNVKTGRVLRSVVRCGYRYVGLHSNGESKQKSIHRLVATAFIPNLENKRVVNHINGIKTDNRVENLEWATDSENVKHAFRTGLRFHSGGPKKQRIRCIETGQEFESQCVASRYFGCRQSSIWQSIYKGSKVLRQFHFELV